MANRSLVIILAIVVVGVFGVLLGTSHHHNVNKTLTPPSVADVNKSLVPETFTDIDGKNVSLASYQGKKLMVYLLATWCSSCQASLQTLLSNSQTLQKDGLTLVILKTYDNAGYPGPSMNQFIASSNNASSSPNNFIFGNASQALTASYNPENTPDIYYLINPSGIIQTVSSTPSASLNTILKFGQGT